MALFSKFKAKKDVKTNKETRQSIARKSFLLKIFSKLYLEAPWVFFEIDVPNMLATETAIFRTTIFKEHLLLAAAATLHNKGLYSSSADTIKMAA